MDALDKPQLVRVGSLIKCNFDGDIGIVIKVLQPVREIGFYQKIMVWWSYENRIGTLAGVEPFDFDPWYNNETVLRY